MFHKVPEPSWPLWLFELAVYIVVSTIGVMILIAGLCCLVFMYLDHRDKKLSANNAENLTKSLAAHDWRGAKELKRTIRQVHAGLLSVGLKLHCSGESACLSRQLNFDTTTRSFRLQKASVCIVLPPVGNVEAAIRLLELLQAISGVKIFQNPDIQIQVCTPGRLSNERAALLGAAYYLGTDRLKRFEPKEYHTTQRGYTCDRLVIYDSEGVFERNFQWWGLDEEGWLKVGDELPFKRERTDILGCRTRTDLRNVNLIASLLVHAQHGGFWGELGNQFVAEFQQLFARHHLGAVLDAVWVRQTRSTELNEYEPADEAYFNHLLELMNYVFDEIGRIAKSRDAQQIDGPNSILFETRDLLARYRAVIDQQQPQLEA